MLSFHLLLSFATLYHLSDNFALAKSSLTSSSERLPLVGRSVCE